MTQPYAYPVDPFPELEVIYETPAVTAVRIEPGRYLTVDIDGVEISWRSDSDEEIADIAASIGHRVMCTDDGCALCTPELETYTAEPIESVDREDEG